MASSATVGILRVLLSANTAEFEAGMKKSASASQNFFKELKASGGEAEKIGGAMAKAFAAAEAGTHNLGKTIAGLIGTDVIQNATTYAKAIESIGGVSKLTAAEQAKVNATVTEALEKYKALGQQAPAALQALAKATTPLVDTNKAWVDRLNSVGQQATNVGMTLTKALTVPLVALGVGAAKAAIDFESSFAGIRKTVDGVVDSAGNLTDAGKKMQQAMRDLAKEIPVSVNELNKLGETAGALGVPRDRVVEFTKVMAELGVTTNLTADDAANSIARIQNIFGAAGQDTDRLASTLVALGNAGASTEKEIVEMAQRIAGAGHTVGLTQAQVLAFASTLASVGINAEAGGSAISRVFLKINDAVAKGGGALTEFARVAGVSVGEFKKLFETDAAGATQKFIEGIARLKGTGENVNATIEGLIGKNIILKDTLLRVAGAGTLLDSQLKLANKSWQDNTALTKEAEQRFKTTEQQMVLLWNRIKDVAITLGNALKPGIDTAIHGITVLLPIVESLAKGFAALPGGVQLVAVGFAALLAAAGPVLLVVGQLATAAANITALFGKQGIATKLLAGDLNTLEGASTRVTTAMGLLGKAAAVAGAAFVGWQIGRLIADLTGLDQKIADSITGLNNLSKARGLAAQGSAGGADAAVQQRLLELTNQRSDALRRMDLITAALLTTQINSLKNDQTRLAIQDSINLAIKRGADANITYAQAIKFNEEWSKKAADSQAWWNTQVEGGGAVAAAAGPAVSMLSKLNAQYAEDLKKIGPRLKEIIPLHDLYGKSAKEIAVEFGVAEGSIDRYLKTVKASGKATKDAAKDIQESTDFVFKFNESTKKLEDSMAKMDAASEKAFKDLKEKGLKGLDDDARKLVASWQKTGEEAGQKLVQGLVKSNKKFHDEAAALQKGLIDLEDDSLQKRQDLIRLDFEERRHNLDKTSSLYQANLDLLNAQEAKALGDSDKQWKESQAQKAQAVLDGLGRAFEQLANISGGSFGGILKDIGEMIALLSLADKAGESLADSFKNIGKVFGSIGKGPMSEIKWKDMATGIMDAATAITTAVAVIGAATDPSHKTTAQTTAGGALAGAKLGSKILPGYGTAIGAGVGALVGWWRGSHAEWKKVAKDIGKDIGQDISDGLAQQIADMAKTLEGGTKQQRREMAELFSLDAIIAEAGGLKSSNVQKYEKQAAGLFEVIQRGGKQGAQATEELNKLMGEFGAQAEKTGGMWDPVFKQMIAQSKALGLNIESVTAAIDGQISKLSGGLAAAIAGAFPKGDTKLDDIGTAKAQEAFDRLSRTALAAFNTIIASGKTAFEAIALLGPSIDALIAQHDKLGLAGGAAFDQLARFRILTEQNKELVASVSGLNDVMVALANLGGLNADVLADLEAQGRAAFEQLTAAGFTEQEALKQMEPLLKSIIKAHEDLGIPIDENTQKIIDQAKANGLLQDDTMSMVDVIKEGLAALIKGFGFDLPDAFKKMAKAGKDGAKQVKDAIDAIPDKKKVVITYDEEGRPSGDSTGTGDTSQGPPPGSSGPTYPTDDPRYQYSTGGEVPEYASTGKAFGRLLQFTPKGTDTVPAMLTPGEGVLNVPAMQTLGRDAFDALNAGINPLARMSSAQPYQRTGTDGGGPSEVYVDVTVTGEIISSRDRAIDIGKSIAVELRKNADLRDVWRTPIKGITESGL